MKFLPVDGLWMAYRIDGPDCVDNGDRGDACGAGGASTLVLVNSLGTDLRMWDQQVALFSRDLRVVRYDCRGHGASGVPVGPYTIKQLGLDLLALFDRLEIDRAHLCGLSLGGMIAMWFAAEYPERVGRAIFANTAARIGTEAIWEERIDAVERGGMAAIRAGVLKRFLSEKFRLQHPEVEQEIGEMIERTNPIGYMGVCAAIRDADLHTMLAAIRVPSLVLTGSWDEATPPAQAQELHEAIAGSELKVLHEVAHLSNIERPAAFGECVRHFLTRA